MRSPILTCIVSYWDADCALFDDEGEPTTNLDYSVPKAPADPLHPRCMHNIADKERVRRAGRRVQGKLWRQVIVAAIYFPISCDILEHIG